MIKLQNPKSQMQTHIQKMQNKLHENKKETSTPKERESTKEYVTGEEEIARESDGYGIK